ncbi:14329_t:CDS:2 [Cetraspora pellucida]|uniref:14329_t:CDS:1 n=1 Tax=Cetraspora pellucida TaxID=1433469 RepID=A0A9N9FPI3_9GLOM|nr:14329_t:CDS:2 [Cetraspora pellucida]
MSNPVNTSSRNMAVNAVLTVTEAETPEDPMDFEVPFLVFIKISTRLKSEEPPKSFSYGS